MDKKQVIEILEEIGTLLELKGENPFKTRAYENAARALRGVSEDLNELVASNRLRGIKGIGEAISEKITTLVTTGTLKYYEELRRSFPPGIMELLRIPGLGPKKAKKLLDDLGVASIDDLEKACKENRVAKLEGFSAKSQQNLLDGIQQIRQFASRHLYHHAEQAARPLFEAVKKHAKVIRAELAGSLRRHKETIKDIDIVASCKEADRAAIMDFFTKLPTVQNIIAKGDTKSSVLLENGIAADLRLTTDKDFPYLLHHLTGSAEHNIALRGHGQKLGIKVSEWGLFKGEKLIRCKDETEIFAALGMSYVPPELREDMGELDAALQDKIPRLIENEDLKGVLHCHSTYSDGANSIREMAEECRRLGFEYFGICDHSMSVYYAKGLSPERVKQQHKEIDKLNAELKGFYIFKGTECDILPDGKLDYPDNVLASFDFVVASIHSSMNMTEEQATKRLIKAMEHPAVKIIGHPTGRLLLGREGYPINHRKVIEAAAELGVSIEINASPHRFDLDWRYCKYAAEKGVQISINPDAHEVAGIADIFYGVGIARKGWLRKNEVLNTKSTKEIAKWFRETR
ncbi:DNA polymerase/3'-5' exonuclease PolX [candidate division KSB1 bacterium]|nr:MAG: DNA polymerase/3'-5' exonuclease PolX [candidate division KSB1 bacterium]MBC6947200.1 DNA polymerase/3'-5' exonuclease PolX [candidate division KSB1 bacterium]MCE7943620.1 DNA polymerase/3'-5' exonuclease PolX [Chlorobi bacterium CHB1]MDL1876245.1 DNA polymerase/3'-5' exonuclease PolX [Cytophagia bacterium CHB2]